MGSPPVQTPVLFLQGGGAAIFSAACIAALLKAGYDPESFGSYKHVRKKIQEAQGRVAKHDDWVKNGRVGPEPTLNPNDRYMARCQAGHISQDATHRKAGGRDNNCANLQMGYDTNLAPCMPQSQGPWSPAGSEHNVASRHEVACALRDGPNKDYDPAQREKDEKARLDLVVKRGDPERKAITPAATSTDGASGTAAGSPTGAGKAAASDAAKPSIPDGDKIQGEDAADCINNFKKAAMQAMRAETMEKRANGQAALQEEANGRPKKPGESDAAYKKAGEDHRAELRKKAEEEEKKAKEVSDERIRLAQSGGGKSSSAAAGREKADEHPDDPKAQQAARDRGERAQDAKGQVAAAESAEAFAQADARAARNASDKADASHCAAEEGAKVAGMTPAQREAAATNGANRGSQEARTSGVSSQTKEQFDKTQKEDPAGPVTV